MCEIFAINARRPVLANAYLREFFADSPRHPHGWGLAWETPQGLWLDKEPLPAYGSEYLAYLLREPIRTAWLVAHIRNATRGVVTYDNCHPFRERDAFGREWVLAHNGTLLEAGLVASFEGCQRGTTDSERVLLRLLAELGGAGEAPSADERFATLARTLAELSVGNKLNLVLGDGSRTYVHTNTLQRTLWRYQGDGLALFCTRPLGDAVGWEPLPRCRLLAYRDGRLVAQGAPHGGSFDDELYLRAIERERREGGAAAIAAIA